MLSTAVPLRPLLLTLALSLAAAGCGDDGAPVSGNPDASAAVDAAPGAPDGAAGGPDASTARPTVFGGDRPATLTVPSTYDPAVPTPLVVALHGYFTSPDYILSLFHLSDFAEAHGVLFIDPDGLANPDGDHYWNATDACCDLFDAGTDDLGYLTGLVADIQAAYNVDPKQIFLLGHSNGAFMSLRLACERPDLFAAVISLAGANALAPADCTPTQPVSILEIHGDEDDTILFEGGTLTQRNGDQVPYPSAAQTVARWATLDGCSDETAADEPLDLASTLPGAETTRFHHTGCPAGIDTELWRVGGAGHVLIFTPEISDTWWNWLSAHARP
jgi:polyhydroxybutyrate depolymerase